MVGFNPWIPPNSSSPKLQPGKTPSSPKKQPIDQKVQKVSFSVLDLLDLLLREAFEGLFHLAKGLSHLFWQKPAPTLSEEQALAERIRKREFDQELLAGDVIQRNYKKSFQRGADELVEQWEETDQTLEDFFRAQENSSELLEIFSEPITVWHLRALPIYTQLKEDIIHRFDVYLDGSTEKTTSPVEIGKAVVEAFKDFYLEEQVMRLSLFQQSLADELNRPLRNALFGDIDKDPEAMKKMAEAPYSIGGSDYKRPILRFHRNTQQLTFSSGSLIKDTESQDIFLLIHHTLTLDFEKGKAHTHFSIEKLNETLSTIQAKIKKIGPLSESFVRNNYAHLARIDFKKDFVEQEGEDRTEIRKQRLESVRSNIEQKVRDQFDKQQTKHNGQQVASFEDLKKIIAEAFPNDEFQQLQVLALFEQDCVKRGLKLLTDEFHSDSSPFTVLGIEKAFPQFKITFTPETKRIEISCPYSICNRQNPTEVYTFVRHEMWIDLDHPEKNWQKFTLSSPLVSPPQL